MVFKSGTLREKGPKRTLIAKKIPFFLHFLLKFYRAFQWYLVYFRTLNSLCCTDQTVNQEIGGYLPFFQ